MKSTISFGISYCTPRPQRNSSGFKLTWRSFSLGHKMTQLSNFMSNGLLFYGPK